MENKNREIKFKDYYSNNIFTWCANCGNYGINAAIKRALVAEGISPKNALICFDIGCHGNGADKIGGYRFHGLHGRAIPFACGAALVNTNITIIASAGDGGTFSEGVNHLVHAIRNNYNITLILHNNSNYALTKGQASATTRQEVSMNTSPDGVSADTINPLKFVLSLNPSFAARAFSGNVKQMTSVIQAGIKHKGFSFVEILQVCTKFNRETPQTWYMERVYDTIEIENYDNTNLKWAQEIAEDLEEKIATGVIYQNKEKPTFLDRQENRKGIETQLVDEVENRSIEKLLKRLR